MKTIFRATRAMSDPNKVVIIETSAPGEPVDYMRMWEPDELNEYRHAMFQALVTAAGMESQRIADEFWERVEEVAK